MSECIILSIDVDHRCIEALFEVQGSWRVNRIHHPVDGEKKPLNLNDPEQVNDYLHKYAQDNYSSVVDMPSLPTEDIGGALDKLANDDYAQAQNIQAILSWIAGIETALAVQEEEHKREIIALRDRMNDIASELGEMSTRWKAEQAERDGRFIILAKTVGQLERNHAALKKELNDAWWRRIAAWVKANSSLLGGTHD